MNSIYLSFINFETLLKIADLTVSTLSDAMSHRRLIVTRHLPRVLRQAQQTLNLRRYLQRLSDLL